MYLFPTLVIMCFGVVASHDKCCNFDEHFKYQSGFYSCVRDVNKRFQVLSDRSNFFKKNSSGSCVEAVSVTGIFLFDIINGEVNQAELVNENYFPKCCPVGYNYNLFSHACVKLDKRKPTFIEGSFMKVGLPNCKVIIDLKSNDDYDRNNTYDYCIDEDQNSEYIRRECRPTNEICKTIRCIRKCCPDGQSFQNTSICYDTHTRGLRLNFSTNIEDYFDPFAVVSNRTCSRIYMINERRIIFTLQKDGVFRYWNNMSNKYHNEDIDSPYSYCIEHANIQNSPGYFFFKCFVDSNKAKKFQYTLWPKIISCVFLILTMGIYMILGETKNLFGKILMNYCVAILILYMILIYTHLDLKPSDFVCKLAGYALIFVSTVSFTCLNIMCCDIWFTFGSTRHPVRSFQRRKDLKRLLIYMTYGWGLPMLLTLTVYIFTLKKILPEAIQPYIGHTKCLIDSSNYASLVFLRVPHLIIQIVNIVLFLRTIIYCLEIKDEIYRINDTTKSEKRKNFQRAKERFALISKLAVIMGVTFIFETTSGFVQMSEMGEAMETVEIIWDFINCSQGILIFIIFICKRKIYRDILKIIGIASDKPSIYTQSIVTSTRTSVLTKGDPVELKKM